jgi:hypothetical protein
MGENTPLFYLIQSPGFSIRMATLQKGKETLVTFLKEYNKKIHSPGLQLVFF